MANKTIDQLPSKANPTDSDLLVIADAADSNEMKQITIGSITADIGDGLIVDGSASTTTTYSSTKIAADNATQDAALTAGLALKLNTNNQLRTGNGAWKVSHTNGSGNEVELALGTAGQVLTSSGATSAPTFTTPTADIVSLTEDTTGDMNADFALVYDNSAGANRKQKVNVFRASDAEAVARTSTSKFVVPDQLSEFKSGTTTKNLADASSTQNIAHGLGKIPANIEISGFIPNASSTNGLREQSRTSYNGTTQTSLSTVGDGSFYQFETVWKLSNTTGANTFQTGVITADATNIIITWTKTGSPTGTFQLFWKANT